MTTTDTDKIEYHRLGYGYESVPAINIKYHGGIPINEEIEADCNRLGIDAYDVHQQAFERNQMLFWEDANDTAQEFGFDEVFSEGRSGGWLIVAYRVGKRLAYPNMEDQPDRRNFLAFRERIQHMLTNIDWLMLDQMQQIVLERWPIPVGDTGGTAWLDA